ncbi:MAG: MoaD/ThiS family protein [Cryobacterium sp.]|nr:MoaD/ThiS family protein [Cryobacterium sp.]
MVQVTVRYFAAAVDAASREEEQLDFGEGANLGDLKRELIDRYGDSMRKVVSSGSFLVDEVVSREDSVLLSSKVDVLPPFAGG